MRCSIFVPLGFLTALALLAAIGCGGGDALDRQSVRGTVTFQGEPLNEGAIQLIPTANGPASGGTIRNGTFRIPRDAGPISGNYRVEIVSYQPTGETQPDPDLPGQTIDVTRQVLPPEFNTRSTQTVEITSGNNDLSFAIP